MGKSLFFFRTKPPGWVPLRDRDWDCWIRCGRLEVSKRAKPRTSKRPYVTSLASRSAGQLLHRQLRQPLPACTRNDACDCCMKSQGNERDGQG